MVDGVSLWLTPANTNIGTLLFLDSSTIQCTSKFLKLIFIPTNTTTEHFTSQFHTYFHIHQHNYLNIFVSLFVNTVVKFFTCLLVVWFAILCFVLSLQLYAWYNVSKNFWELSISIHFWRWDLKLNTQKLGKVRNLIFGVSSDHIKPQLSYWVECWFSKTKKKINLSKCTHHLKCLTW